MDNDRLIKIIFIIAFAILLGYTCSTAYKGFENRYKTQTAYVQEVSESTDADLFIIRDETIIEGTGEGIVVPLAVNGERVSNGSEIAAVFNNETAAENYSNSISLRKKLDVYKKIDSQVRLANLDLDKLSEEINNEFYAMLDSAYSNDFSSLGEHKLNFDEKLSRKNISLGYEVDCSGQIAELENRISSLTSTPNSVISASSAGFFVNRPDGYEDVLNIASVDYLTPERLEEAFSAEKAEIPSGTIGKILNGYEWYAASCVTSPVVAELSKGKTVKLVLGDSDNEVVSAVVYSNTLIEGNKSLVVFKCTYMNEKLATIRKVSGKIITGSHKGIKVKKDSIRFNDEGDMGVYIKEGNLIKFNRVKELYSNDAFLVAEDMSGTSGWLAKYDEIVISGKELSNGKVLY